MNTTLTPLFPKSLRAGENVFSGGLLQCGLQYEVVGLTSQYALLIEGIRVREVAGTISVSDVVAWTVEDWNKDRFTTLRKLKDILAKNIGWAHIQQNEVQARTTYLYSLHSNLSKFE